ncbi:Probable methyltransferase PMT5 [Olea europaea subsp. europaea]|uniref:Methyltransferase n=1 Tax=Olea europaea subsp. europaea TaxID=158383 RepID=A0A8S0VDI8_OLEEU|nr:Probable methyltransferase PMT5 [Olea europaea subsp. europaea]
MDMNGQYGGLNAAFVEARKSLWMMNFVPLGAHNTLPIIIDRGFLGVLHDLCKPIPTYSRTYDMLHAKGLSHLASKGCSVINLLFEMDRILRPEGWIIISDKIGPIEKAHSLTTELRWEVCVIDLQNGSDQRLLGWIIISDKIGPIDKARSLTTELRWEARVIDLQNGIDQRLLACQKEFTELAVIVFVVGASLSLWVSYLFDESELPPGTGKSGAVEED